jgi:PTS system N-acetylglucosamine-specific IIC component
MLAGIVSGLMAGALYNRFKDIKLPEYLAFFGGRRFVPIVTGFAAVGLGVVFGYIWPPIQHGINSFGALMMESGSLGAFVFGVFNRLLIVTGLHHILNNMAWFVFGNFTDPTTGALVTGDLSRYFAGDPKGGQFMTGMFPMMIFGLPAACLAMYRNALPERRKVMGGIFLSMALTSFLTGVTEPIEFAFMFLAPLLYLLHALLTGLSMAITNALNIHLGFTFSGGFIDMVLGWGRSTNGWLVIPVGLAYAVVYYAVFDFCIRRFNLKTPGREDVAVSEKAVLTENERAGAYIKALGGAENLVTVGACTTRLRLEMVDRNKASDAELKALGAMAVVRPGKGGSLQVVVGPMADSIADEIRLAMPSLGRAVLVETAVVADEPKAFVVASSEAQQWLNALGGGDNVLQLDCIAMSRIRLLLADGKALSDAQLKELGCQGVSQLEGGVWHLLVGDKAASLSGALEALVNRTEVNAKV